MKQRQGPAPNHDDHYFQQQHPPPAIVSAQPRPQFVLQQEIDQHYVPSYTVLSWLACIFCFWPMGIAAVVKSKKVNSALEANNIEGAKQASRSARNYAILAVVFGLILIVILVASMLTSSSNINWI